jgi:hypothetical protein
MIQSQSYGPRARARVCLERLAARPDVVGHDLIAAQADPTNKPTIEIVIDADAVPSGVLGELADAGLGVREARPRNGHLLVVATADDVV